VLSAPYPFHTICVFGGTKLASFDVPSTAGKPSLPMLGVSSANLDTLLRDAHRAERGVRLSRCGVSIIHELQKGNVAAEDPVVESCRYILADPPAIQLYRLRS
jgi:hypothetical protein